MYLNPLYRRFSRIAFLFIIVFNLGINLNGVQAQKLNLKEKINAIKNKNPDLLAGIETKSNAILKRKYLYAINFAFKNISLNVSNNLEAISG